MRYGSLFSGIGGVDLGLDRAGWQCVFQVEIDPFCQKILSKRWPDAGKYTQTLPRFVGETWNSIMDASTPWLEDSLVKTLAKPSSAPVTCASGCSSLESGQTWRTPCERESRAQAMNRPTPRAHEAGEDFAKATRSKTGMELKAVTANWRTPTEGDHKRGAHPTPDASETGSENNTHDKTPNLSRQVYRLESPSRPAPTTTDGPTSCESAPTLPRRLNPRFVEWLMGFPIGWSKP